MLACVLLAFPLFLQNQFWANKAGVIAGLIKPLGMLIIATLTFALVEAMRMDVRKGSFIEIGNHDISFYAGFGHNIVSLGRENMRVMFENINSDILYHFGDLWPSGIGSHYFNLLPQYSYGIVYRSITFIIVGLLAFQISKKIGLGTYHSILATIISIFSVGIPVPNIFFESEFSLFQLFEVSNSLYVSPPYQIFAIAVLTGQLLIVEGFVVSGIILMFVAPALNPALSLTMPIVGAAIVAEIAVKRLLHGSSLFSFNFTFAQRFLLFVFSMLTIAYVIITQRNSHTLQITPHYVYLLVHTFVRFFLSLLFLVPYFFGLLAFWPRHRIIVQLQFFLALGTAFAFCVTFPHVQGNSIQIYWLYATAVIIPVGSIGIVKLAVTQIGVKKWGAIVLTTVLSALAINHIRETNAFKLFYNSQAWNDLSRISVIEYEEMAQILTANLPDVAYCNCNVDDAELVRYPSLTFMKALFPGIELHRLCPAKNDGIMSVDELSWYSRTSLFHYSAQGKSKDEIIGLMNKAVRPMAFIVDSQSDSQCLPPELESDYQLLKKTGRFTFYQRVD